jgi:methanogenic corrinoid protein MtbC1
MKELHELAELIKQGEVDRSIQTVNEIIDRIAVDEIIATMTAAMRELGQRFEKKEVFIPELLVASDVITELMPLLEPYIQKQSTQKKTVVLGTVEGDIHEIGKNIVSVVLKAEGFRVADLGTDVPVDTFLAAAGQQEASVIGLSTLMTTTMHVQGDLIEKLIEQEERDSYFVIVGGAPVSRKWADRIGADAYGEDAFATAALLNSLP